MKKFFSFVLALAMTASLLCSSALAAPAGADDPSGFSSNHEVKIQKVGGDVIHRYSVDIEYESMVFTYTAADETWDPDTYKYAGEANAATGWSGNGDVKIINHSDLGIRYQVSARGEVDNYGDLDITVDGASGTIDACAPGIAVGSKNATAEVGVSGTPTSALKGEAVHLGYVDVTISAL